MESLKRSLASVRRRYTLLRSTKENAYYSWTVHDVVTVPYAMRFHSLDAILDRRGTFRLDLICSVFLAQELVFFYYRFVYSFSRSFQLSFFSIGSS